MTYNLVRLVCVTVPLMVSTNLYAATPSCPEQPYALSVPEGYDHTRYAPMPLERRYDGGSFVASVDGPDDDNSDGMGEYLVQPNWVSSHIRAAPSDRPGNFHPGFKRPRYWYRLSLFNQERAVYHTNKTVNASYSGSGNRWNRGHPHVR